MDTMKHAEMKVKGFLKIPQENKKTTRNNTIQQKSYKRDK